MRERTLSGLEPAPERSEGTRAEPAQPADVPELPGRGGAPAQVAAITLLQRTHGNQAVARRLLQRNGPDAPTAAPPSPQEAAADEAITAQDWPRAAQALAALDERTIDAKIAPLGSGPLFHLLIGSGFSTDPRVAVVSHRVSLRLHELQQQGVEADIRRATQDSQYDAAAWMLLTLDEARRVTFLKTLDRLDLNFLATSCRNLPVLGADRLYRQVRFAIFDPGAHGTESQFTNATGGTVEAESDVPGGHVRARMGPRIRTTQATPRELDDGYELEYEGRDATRTHWLQFIWREIEVTHPVRGSYRVTASITTSGGSYDLTTDTRTPNYNTDALPGAATPFYEHSGGHNRTAEGTTMWDRPSSMDDLVQAEWGRGATRVVSRAHFNTFLVRDMDVLHRIGVDVEWDYPNRTVPPRTQHTSNAGAASALDPRMRQRLIEQFPNFDYIP